MQVNIEYNRERKVIEAYFTYNLRKGEIRFNFSFDKGSSDIDKVYTAFKNNRPTTMEGKDGHIELRIDHNGRVFVYPHKEFTLELPSNGIMEAFSHIYAISNDLEDI